MLSSIEKGFDEDGIRSIADKIKTRLHDLDKTVDSNKGRWVWELLQNAKDSIVETVNRKVSVQIELNNDNVTFRHNGKHFDEQDIRGIINQISSKEVTDEIKRKQTGRFGTGFLTTHILSKKIRLKGIFISTTNEQSKFDFLLDRTGRTTEALIPQIIQARHDFLISVEKNKIKQHEEHAFNTSFSYDLNTDIERGIARVGIDEFSKLVPYVLASNKEIASVEIIDNTQNYQVKFENSVGVEKQLIIEIFKTEFNKTDSIKLLYKEDIVNSISIAAIIEITKEGYNILDLNNIPKIFCDFPLIGTEKFYFPVIVNSFNFTPQTERDGIWLRKEDDPEVRKNREILEIAVELYKQLLTEVSNSNFYKLYNIADTRDPEIDNKYFDEKWYKNSIQIPLRNFLLNIPIVDTIRSGKVAIVDGEATVDFPKGINDKEREQVWELCNINEYFILPLKSDIHKWNDILWTNDYNCSEENIIHFISTKENIVELQKDIGAKNVFQWLNEVYNFTIKDKKNLEAFKKYAALPNQKGTFKKRNGNDIFNDQIKDRSLKEIACQLGYDYYDILIADEIHFEEQIPPKTIDNISRHITDEINKYLKSGHDKEETKIAIRQLTKWFKNNEEEGKKYFSELYKRREKLFVDTIKDQENLYRVADNEEQLPALARIAEAIRNDHGVLSLIENLIREKQELTELKIVGENFEKVLAEALTQLGFSVRKVIVGQDLVITLSNSQIEYSIEVKSTKNLDFVAMTSVQGKAAYSKSGQYALCVIYNDGNPPTVEYIKENARLVLNIGDQLKAKVIKAEAFENTHLEISKVDDEIVLTFENGLDYKYNISHKVWGQGKRFNEFITFLSEEEKTNSVEI